MALSVGLWASALGSACGAQSSSTDDRARSEGRRTADAWAAYDGPTDPVRPAETCTITRIVDGDTLRCEPVGRVRLLGIDAPEQEQAPFASQATRALQAMLPVGATVRLEPDVEPRDRYDRALRYVWIDQGMINWAMVRSGHAVTLTYPPNVQHADALQRALDAARRDRAGLWTVDGFACLPVAFRRGTCP